MSRGEVVGPRGGRITMPSPRVSVKCYLWFTVSFCLNTYHGGRFEIIYFTGMCITDARAHICSRLQPPSRRVNISFICPHADQIDIYCPKYFIERLHWSYFSALLCIYVYPCTSLEIYVCNLHCPHIFCVYI